jgi:hypothetical protein
LYGAAVLLWINSFHEEKQQVMNTSIGTPNDLLPHGAAHSARHETKAGIVAKTADNPLKSRKHELDEIAPPDRTEGRLARPVSRRGKRALPEVTDAPLEIIYRPLRDIVPYSRNARTHTAKQIAKIRASLAAFGWTNPMLVAGPDLLAGHARQMAAIAMAEAGEPIARNRDPWTAPTVDLSHLTPADRRAYIIADNRLALDAGWDRELLTLEMSELKMGGFDLSVVGFNAVELTTLFGTDNSSAMTELPDGMVFQVVVDCSGEEHQAELMEELQSRGLKCKPLIL